MAAFTLREMKPSDSEEIRTLITDTSGMVTEFVIDPYQAMMVDDRQRSFGVVAEADGYEGLVGLAVVSFGDLQFEGEPLPYAYLSSLKVREDFRKQGLGAKLAQWRVDKARQEFGEDGVITTGMMSSNIASRNTAKKWCREYFEPVHFLVSAIRRKPPQAPANITVREATHEELEEVVEKQNRFYKDYNLYRHQTPEKLSQMLSRSPVKEPLNRYHVAVNQSGDIVAGAWARNRSLLMIDRMLNPPLPMRLVNSIVHFMPSDYTLRSVDIEGLWHLPDYGEATSYLWEYVRWYYREKATMIAMPHDTRNPLQQFLPKNPWYFPKIEIAYAIHGPKPMNPERLVYSASR